MEQHYYVHRFSNGSDSVIGEFWVKDGSIEFRDDYSFHMCDMFPPGPMGASTRARLTNLLDNKNKVYYITRA